MFDEDAGFNNYEIIGELGEGAQGKVYKVRWQNRKGEVVGALKFLNSSEFREILKEVSNWARVSQHPNILTFITADEDKGRFFIISEIANGGDLEKWGKAKGGKAEFFEEAIEIMRGVLEGLNHLHQNDVIHRDIKPANILLNDNTPILADFGLSRGLDLGQSSKLAGTLAFMSPELIKVYLNWKVGSKLKYERTELDDLWATAGTFQQILTGETPFENINAISNCQPMPLPANVPDYLRNFLNKAFAKNINERFQTAKEMQEALVKEVSFELADTEPTPTPRPTPSVSAKEIKNSIGMEFVKISAGSFMMGSPMSEKDRYDDEGPQHRVTISRDFYMGKYEVTQGQWKAVMGTNPSYFKGDNLPVESVSWEDAQEFIKKLNGKGEGTYRLPSEAEWEYAARAGTTTAFAFGDSLSSEQANFNGNYPYGGAAKGKYLEKTTAVGSYRANAWGLYDMHGNVWEWCQDWFGKYPSGEVTDPTGAATGSYRVFRGGSWDSYGGSLRSANRNSNTPSDRNGYLGFRLIRGN